jgi:hypothetical protein
VADGLVSHGNVVHEFRAEVEIAEQIVLALEIDAVMGGGAVLLFGVACGLIDDALVRAEAGAGEDAAVAVPESFSDVLADSPKRWASFGRSISAVAPAFAKTSTFAKASADKMADKPSAGRRRKWPPRKLPPVLDVRFRRRDADGCDRDGRAPREVANDWR